jgi:choline kinase
VADKGRTGIILAAGFGSRLKEAGSLKPLTLVAGVPLLLRAVHGMEKAGCARIVVVVGHGKDDVIAGLAGYRGASEIIFADNPRHDLANGVSVLAARPYVPGDFVLAMADHVVGDEVMALARDTVPAPGTAVLLVDYKLDTIFDMDDATKVLARDGRIDRIGKTIPDYNCVDCGVFVCSPALMEAIASVYDGKGDASLSDGVQALAGRGDMLVADIGDGFWQDVDTPDMLAHAEAEFAKRQ